MLLSTLLFAQVKIIDLVPKHTDVAKNYVTALTKHEWLSTCLAIVKVNPVGLLTSACIVYVFVGLPKIGGKLSKVRSLRLPDLDGKARCPRDRGSTLKTVGDILKLRK